jgi:hypothetical protein
MNSQLAYRHRPTAKGRGSMTEADAGFGSKTSCELNIPEFCFNEELRKERRVERIAALDFVRACQADDVNKFFQAVDFINERTVGGWTTAIRKFAREVRTVSPEIQSAFLRVWIESKMLPRRVGDHQALCDAARVLLPKYRGPAVHLFRGAGALERRRRAYGMCWSADVAAAERFAEEYRVMDGGSVLLETVAPPEAIISAVAYPPPFTQEEIAELKARYPDVKMEQPTEYHEEREYIIDRRLLHGVNVTRRFDALAGPPGLRLRGSGPDRGQGPSGTPAASV